MPSGESGQQNSSIDTGIIYAYERDQLVSWHNMPGILLFCQKMEHWYVFKYRWPIGIDA